MIERRVCVLIRTDAQLQICTITFFIPDGVVKKYFDDRIFHTLLFCVFKKSLLILRAIRQKRRIVIKI